MPEISDDGPHSAEKNGGKFAFGKIKMMDPTLPKKGHAIITQTFGLMATMANYGHNDLLSNQAEWGPSFFFPATWPLPYLWPFMPFQERCGQVWK